MKEKILPFIVGLIIGAVIASGIFLVLNNGKQSSSGEFAPPDGTEQTGTRPEKPSGDMKNKKSNTTDTTTNTTTNTTTDTTTTE